MTIGNKTFTQRSGLTQTTPRTLKVVIASMFWIGLCLAIPVESINALTEGTWSSEVGFLVFGVIVLLKVFALVLGMCYLFVAVIRWLDQERIHAREESIRHHEYHSSKSMF